MRRVVISDASPLHYLILIRHAEVLPSLYAEVLIPDTVYGELQKQATPESVHNWIVHPPSWLHVVPVDASTSPAGEAENESCYGSLWQPISVNLRLRSHNRSAPLKVISGSSHSIGV